MSSLSLWDPPRLDRTVLLGLRLVCRRRLIPLREVARAPRVVAPLRVALVRTETPYS